MYDTLLYGKKEIKKMEKMEEKRKKKRKYGKKESNYETGKFS
jgi:hypothetical protein